MTEKKRKRASVTPFAGLNETERAAAEALASGQSLQQVIGPIVKRIVEACLEAEMNVHLDQQANMPNRRNGLMSKQVKTNFGSVEINTPRDRNGSFEPVIIPKRQTVLTRELDEKVISLYAFGMSYHDIQSHMQSIYGIDLSPATLSAITEKVIDDVKQWQNRPLERVYAVLWLDAIHFKVRHNNSIITKAVHTIIGITADGHKDVLGFYINNTEGARFWRKVLEQLQARGVRDVLIACIDNLKGFAEAIEDVFPRTQVQLCIVHQVRNSLRYVSWKDQREMRKGMARIYKAPTIEAAELAMKDFSGQWSQKHAEAVRSWEDNWERLTGYFSYNEAIRRLIYTTNMIEGFNSQLRKVTKSKRVFFSDDGLLKLLFLVQRNITARWDKPRPDWSQISRKFEQHFGERFSRELPEACSAGC